MCLPVAALAVGSLVAGAASTGLQAYGQYKAGKTAKANANAEAAFRSDQAMLAFNDAAQVEAFGALNSDLTLTISGLNNKVAQSITDTNVALINATTDFNVGVIKATTDFNVSSAEGAAKLLDAQGEAQAMIHGLNADYLETQAQGALEAGNQSERQSRAAYAQLKSQQRARLAANGVALDEGSALRIQSDTDYASEVDADVIKTNAMNQAFGYRVQSINERATGAFASLDAKSAANQKRMEGVAAKINGSVGIAQTTINGAISVADKKLTTSMQILQNETNAKIDAMNIKTDATRQALELKQQGLGFTASAAQAKRTAKSINPALMGVTSLAGGIANLAGQASGFKQAGAFGG